MEAAAGILLYHGGPCDLPNNRPSGQGWYHFGDADFFRGLNGWFGDCVYVYRVPPEVAKRILTISWDRPPKKFLNAAVGLALSRQFWGPSGKKELPKKWDEDTMDEYFAELVTNSSSSGIVEVIRQFGLYGIDNLGEYILLQDGIDKLEFQKKYQAKRQ